MKNSSFALECVVTLVLLMQHFISDLSPVTKTALMACTILIWLITGIMLLVKKDRQEACRRNIYHHRLCDCCYGLHHFWQSNIERSLY